MLNIKILNKERINRAPPHSRTWYATAAQSSQSLNTATTTTITTTATTITKAVVAVESQ